MSESGEGKKVVMVAIDESECSHYALEWALNKLKDSLERSELLIYTVMSTLDYSYIYASSMGYAPPELIRSFQEQQGKVADALLEKATEICKIHGIVPKTVKEAGDPKEKICEAVEKYKAHMLVLGSHGRGTIKRALLGSVSNYCVHHAKCAVLVVKKKE